MVEIGNYPLTGDEQAKNGLIFKKIGWRQGRNILHINEEIVKRYIYIFKKN